MMAATACIYKVRAGEMSPVTIELKGAGPHSEIYWNLIRVSDGKQIEPVLWFEPEELKRALLIEGREANIYPQKGAFELQKGTQYVALVQFLNFLGFTFPFTHYFTYEGEESIDFTLPELGYELDVKIHLHDDHLEFFTKARDPTLLVESVNEEEVGRRFCTFGFQPQDDPFNWRTIIWGLPEGRYTIKLFDPGAGYPDVRDREEPTFNIHGYCLGEVNLGGLKSGVTFSLDPSIEPATTPTDNSLLVWEFYSRRPEAWMTASPDGGK